MERSIDLLTMGRAAVDLYSDQLGASLEDASSFSMYLGGCPANIAVGSARLGLKSAILSKVGDEAMGRFVRQQLQMEGVDTEALFVDADRLTGLVLLGVCPPDHFPLIFYRRDCADMALTYQDVDAAPIGLAKALLVTGTHCSTKQARDVTIHAVKRAVSLGTQVVLDVDYRPVLWGLTGPGDGELRYVATQVVHEQMAPLLRYCDVIVGTDEELAILAGVEDPLDAAMRLRNHTDALIVRKKGSEGSAVYVSGSKHVVIGKAFSVDVMNVLGAGDAFLAGFLRGYLRGESLERCCTLANANGALVVTRHGCAPAMAYWDELESFIAGARGKSVESQHSRESRKPASDLCVLAVDHRMLFEGVTGDVHRLKSLVVQAAEKVQDMHPHLSLGLILDDQYAGSVMQDVRERGFWLARCVEDGPGFLEGREAADILRSWPKGDVIKVFLSGMNDIALLPSLSRACQVAGHELLVEIVGADVHEHIAYMEAIYRLDVFPAWWKLPMHDSAGDWELIRQLVRRRDPSCFGALILGDKRPLTELAEAFEGIPRDFIRGFAVGRSFWQDEAEAYLQDALDENTLIDTVAKKYSFLVEAWYAFRGALL